MALLQTWTLGHFLKILLVISSIFSSQAFAAGEVVGAHVTAVRSDKTGSGYIKFDAPLSATPASCISGHEYYLAFDLNTPGGQGIMSIGLSALATGKTVKAVGTGSCDIMSVVESWSWGYIYEE